MIVFQNHITKHIDILDDIIRELCMFVNTWREI